MVELFIDGRKVAVPEGTSVRQAALHAGIYVPGLCGHPDLDAFRAFLWSEVVWQGEKEYRAAGGVESRGSGEEFRRCGLCVAAVDGVVVRTCDTRAVPGMSVATATPEVVSARREALKKILARHPHACLTCAQREGCDRLQCSMNVPPPQRCCELLGRCEIGKVADYIGIPADTPAYHPEGRPLSDNEPLFIRDFELCVNCLRCVRVCREVRGVDALGAVVTAEGVKVGTVGGPTLAESGCRFCGACVEVCPTGALRDRPDCPPLTDGAAPCTAACPLGIDVPGYLELIAQGLEYEALELIRERAALPGVLGYACFHPCEEVCRRGCVDGSATAICALKRYVADAEGDKPSQVLRRGKPTGRRVLVVGGGPAGLACAAELLKAGHNVTVMDSAPRLGGMLVQAVPEFRLPASVVERDVGALLDMGLKVRAAAAWPEAAEDGEDWDAVVVAVGLAEPARLEVPGEDLPGVTAGLDLLRRVRAGDRPEMGRRVAVIGGGSVAVDAAMTARRLGADHVEMICLEDERELPAAAEELADAREEGVRIRHRWGVREIRREGDELNVGLKRCVRVFDAAGRFAPEYDEDVTEVVKCDRVVVAIGQRLSGQMRRWLEAREGLVWAGDARTGPASIVRAMADGVRAAREVNRCLGAPDASVAPLTERARSGWLGRDNAFVDRSRREAAKTPAEVRTAEWTAYRATLERTRAMEEAARCLRCHLRATLAKAPLPPDPWRPFAPETAVEIPAEPGVLVLADAARRTVKVMGAPDLKAAMAGLAADGLSAEWCRWELDPMFTKRESELIQAHLQAHGTLPGADELDDLY